MSAPTDRERVASSAANKLESSGRDGLARLSAVVGFDGFVDSIIDVVDTRFDMSDSGYTAIRTIEQFAARVGSAAGKSTNIELVVKEDRFGGNGPLMAGGLGRLGLPTTYIGAVGAVDSPRALHPLYKELERRCRAVFPIAPPAHTDALEFEDGKLMLGRPRNIQSVTWDAMNAAIGAGPLRRMFEEASLIGIVNWVMMRGTEGIWEGLCSDVFAKVKSDGRARRVFIDLCDPAKRTDADVRRALSALARMNELAPVTLGLNLAEAERIAGVLGFEALNHGGMHTLGSAVEMAAVRIREKLALDAVVIHPREGAAAADARGNRAWFDGPFTARPKLSTGAGDHFNAGFSLAQTLGLELAECLAVGCAVSGAYVRDAESPGLDRLAAFLRGLPGPESVR
ncbi:MAG: carbohydrate kinase family protein [Phycisphaerales bacterium]|nr:carbohydrate kinase family protein [Phycisphaerales bacterium]